VRRLIQPELSDIVGELHWNLPGPSTYGQLAIDLIQLAARNDARGAPDQLQLDFHIDGLVHVDFLEVGM
jgi:hypothetical protein